MVSPGKGNWAGAWGGSRAGAAPTQHSRDLLQLPPPHGPAREGERGNNRKRTLVICLKFCNSRGERETTAQNRNLFLGWARSTCPLPPRRNRRRFRSPGAASPRWAPSPGREAFAQAPASPGIACRSGPNAKSKPNAGCRRSSRTAMGRRVSNTVGLVALSSSESGI